jgi:glycosyltransferase involved in cell wall biosynthesis
MKIGLSTSVIQRGKTGVAQYIFSLLRAFADSDAAVRFSLFTFEEDIPFFEKLDDRFAVIPVPEKYRPPVKNIVWHQTTLPRLARDLDLDLLHVPSYRRLLFKSPCPRVGTIHDLAPFRVSKKYDFARMFYGRVVVKRLARRQTEIIAVSENTARDIQQFFGIPRASIRVIHNGLNHDHFYPRNRGESRQLAATKFGLANPFLLYVARLEHPGKNHVRLIEAFERFKEETRSKWTLALGGSDWHGAEVIHQRIASSPHHPDIKALGFVSDADLPGLYSAAQGFVYPSLYEGFGLPPIEAMACACPVICSDRGSLGEVVSDAAAIIDPEEISSITKALLRLASDPEWRQALVQRGLPRAQYFSWHRTARETLSVYESACRGSATQAVPRMRLHNPEMAINHENDHRFRGQERRKADVNRY